MIFSAAYSTVKDAYREARTWLIRYKHLIIITHLINITHHNLLILRQHTTPEACFHFPGTFNQLQVHPDTAPAVTGVETSIYTFTFDTLLVGHQAQT